MTVGRAASHRYRRQGLDHAAEGASQCGDHAVRPETRPDRDPRERIKLMPPRLGDATRPSEGRDTVEPVGAAGSAVPTLPVLPARRRECASHSTPSVTVAAVDAAATSSGAARTGAPPRNTGRICTCGHGRVTRPHHRAGSDRALCPCRGASRCYASGWGPAAGGRCRRGRSTAQAVARHSSQT